MDYRCGSNGNVSFLPIAQSSLRHRRESLSPSRKLTILAIDRMTLTEFEISIHDSYFAIPRSWFLTFVLFYIYIYIYARIRNFLISVFRGARIPREKKAEERKETSDNPLGA